MRVNGQNYRTIWKKDESEKTVQIIDQRYLPHEFLIVDLLTYQDAIVAIKDMAVRGAPLIGGTAAWGMYLAGVEARKNGMGFPFVLSASQELVSARPTATNLNWSVARILKAIDGLDNLDLMIETIEKEATDICNEDVINCENIGNHGLELIRKIAEEKSNDTVNVLTHCNAGWLATIDIGTATAPIYAARDDGINIHVWVDETRPRNQGANLTAWELLHEGIPHTVIVDNAGGHLMQKGLVDICIVGSDRTTRSGDVANKIGTYLKALAARDNNVPFFVALPDSTIDWKIRDGLADIPIEERDENEVSSVTGSINGKLESLRITPVGSKSLNYAFDVTPAQYVTGLITPRGVCNANEDDINNLYPEY